MFDFADVCGFDGSLWVLWLVVLRFALVGDLLVVAGCFGYGCVASLFWLDCWAFNVDLYVGLFDCWCGDLFF